MNNAGAASGRELLSNLPKINSTPTVEQIPINCSIEDLYSHFSDQDDTSFLNSSLETDAGRYSFIGTHPFLTFKGKGTNLTIRTERDSFSIQEDPFKCLESILTHYKTNNTTNLPFTAGGIGYLSYDLKDRLEILPQKAQDDLDLPDIYFVFYRTILIYDRQEPGRITVAHIGVRSPHLTLPTRPHNVKCGDLTPISVSGSIELNFTKKSYTNAIKSVIEHIRAGDIYQACLSQRFKTTWPHDPYDLYLKLNKLNPSPFSAYLNFIDSKIISSSPELFLRKRQNTIETRPMKGTRRRGGNPQEDKALKLELDTSTKDTAELSMITDLERNDLGRVCVPGSIRVVESRRIETYPTVFQAISVIQGEQNKTSSLVEVIKAAFPGGSITGCPKIRAMEILDELEPTQRGIYTGSIGYISFHDTMDLNIAIRTMVVKGTEVYFAAGGGIVADSDPELEYEETLVKARALIDSLSK